MKTAPSTEAQKTHGKARSPQWPALRKTFLAGKACAVCRGSKKLEAHHVRPFHLHPELELDQSNLIALCENKGDGINCHLAFGHLGSFQSFNVHVRTDAPLWAEKIKDRPKGEKE